MSRTKRGLALGAALLATALVAAACGGDDDAATSATLDEAVKSGVGEQLADTATTAVAAEHPTSLAGWEELWAEERAAIVERIRSEGLGVSADGASLTGPAGFAVDVAACPAGWSPTEGVSDSSIKIGMTIAQSGTFADYGNIGRAMQAYFNHVNEEGGIADATGASRRIDFVMRDDGYDPARTIPLVDELIDSEKVFTLWTLGSGNALRVYDKLGQRCIPQMVTTGHPAWGDPVNHPWTTGSLMAYSTEAIMWGTFIEQHLDEMGGSAKIGALVMANDLGVAYQKSLEAYLADSPHAADIELVTETIEPQAPTVKDPMTTLAAQDPDVFIVMAAGAPCTQAIIEAAENGLKESADHLFMPSTCKASTFVGRDKVGGDGSASDGWLIFGGGIKDFNSTAFDDDPFVAFARDILAEEGFDYTTSGSFGSGFIFAWPTVEALRIAGELDGGLTRPNFLLANRAMQMTHPIYLPGVGFNMDGAADAYFIEGSDLARWDAASQTWAEDGPIVELSGKSKPCAFDQATAVCN